MSIENIKVTLGTRTDMAKEFIETWHQTEAGHAQEAVETKLYFENDRALFKMLTPRRCDLLRYVHNHGLTSILALSKKLKRDYRNVYQDVRELSQIGLMVKDEKTGQYHVPWKAIITEISLTEPTSHKISSEQGTGL